MPAAQNVDPRIHIVAVDVSKNTVETILGRKSVGLGVGSPLKPGNASDEATFILSEVWRFGKRREYSDHHVGNG